MKKFKGYDVVKEYPKDGWLKGYFYVNEPDSLKAKNNQSMAYQDLNFIKHKDHLLFLMNISEKDKILDIGCADGAMMIYCGLLGAEVYGQDLSEEQVAKANEYIKLYCGNSKSKAIVGDATKIEFPDSHFDKVVSSDFLEHLTFEENVNVLKEILRVLKPNGSLFIKTPNIKYLRLSLWLKRIKALFKLKNPFDIIIPHTVGVNGERPEHVGLSSKKEIMKMLELSGFNSYEFFYSRNSKLDLVGPYSNEIISCEIPFLRDLLTEDVVLAARKSVIMHAFQIS